MTGVVETDAKFYFKITAKTTGLGLSYESADHCARMKGYL